MMAETELLAAIEVLDVDTLQRWIVLGWIRPLQDDAGTRFDAADVERVRLICDLHFELQIEEDAMPVVLSLMDQLYAARRSLRRLATAVAAQPAAVRGQIAELVSGDIDASGHG